MPGVRGNLERDSSSRSSEFQRSSLSGVESNPPTAETRGAEVLRAHTSPPSAEGAVRDVLVPSQRSQGGLAHGMSLIKLRRLTGETLGGLMTTRKTGPCQGSSKRTPVPNQTPLRLLLRGWGNAGGDQTSGQAAPSAAQGSDSAVSTNSCLKATL